MEALRKAYPDDGPKRLLNWQAQLWAFLHSISVGDLIVLPLKTSPSVAIGHVTGDYRYRNDLPSDARHTRPVEWQTSDVPRTAIGQDLLYSLGAFLTVCQIKRHDAAKRLARLADSGHDPGWAGVGVAVRATAPTRDADTPSDEETTSVDVQQYADDQISARIEQEFTGHDMALLVEAIFAARGMVTWRSPEGPDGGVDVLAGSGPLGMDSPRICVQVKSSNTPMAAGVVRELQGVVGRLQADQGLLVAWGGLTQAAEREIRQQFFQVRVWNADDVLRELLAIYERLPGDVRAKLPLKQIWTLATEDEAQ
jgi:restriction system protein